ncbi:glycolate oxidase subunit GlcE [Rhodospirillaceae bacterium AH-315-P19]|nr:glycolate oxidase subunit GlcE [Rhodospirillaceae bacterium AH-315-P19]
MGTHFPRDEKDVAAALGEALANDGAFEIVAGGSKCALGRPVEATEILDVSGLSGVTMYEPEELVFTARAATPMVEIETLLRRHGQQLAFEPPDYGPLFGTPPQKATLGGVLACNLSGPRRVKAGAARDHFLGFRAVSGRGEIFKAGGRVVKNVTGYDLSKLMAGSFGTLAVLLEGTLKVEPAPEKSRTVLIYGLDSLAAAIAMGEAQATPNEISGAAHLPAAVAAKSAVDFVASPGVSVVALRVEGPGRSVGLRAEALRKLGARFGETAELHSAFSALFWKEVRDVHYFAGETERIVWRLSLPPAASRETVRSILSQVEEGDVFSDWGGGLVWLRVPSGAGAFASLVHKAAIDAGGHALLVRAPVETRQAMPVFSPLPEAMHGLTERMKAAFDPKAILNPGRMYPGI